MFFQGLTEKVSDRRIDAFFYGLYMDSDVLAENGIEIVNARPAYVDNFAVILGNRATLVAAPGRRSYGLVLSVTHSDVNKLYSVPGLEDYCPEALLVTLMGQETLPAIVYNLVKPPQPDEKNPEYAKKLKEALRRLEFPTEYIASIG